MKRLSLLHFFLEHKIKIIGPLFKANTIQYKQTYCALLIFCLPEILQSIKEC